MHTVHHTDAVILKSVHSGEANKRVWLFTKEFGLIVATVQGVRKTEAKLKGHITDYTFILADLVKGRDVWRLVSATERHNPLAGTVRAPLARVYVRTLSMLARFLIDEGVHEELYVHVVDIAQVVSKQTLDAAIVDAWSIWKMLALLGYIAPTDAHFPLVSFDAASAVPLIDENTRRTLVDAATDAIIQSHL